jgi:hypothetical protein
MIYLNEQQISDISDFNPRFQTILSTIVGGTDWLIWAIEDTTMPACRVSSENELLELIQEGLHANMFIRFNCCRISLAKLLSMPDSDVEQLAMVRNTSFDSETSLQSLLTRNNIYSYGDMASVNSFITSQNLTGAQLFEMPSFSDMLTLTALIKQLADIKQAIQNQALIFAQANAASVQELSDLVLFYSYCANNLFTGNIVTLVQQKEISTFYTELLKFTNYLLFTPNIGSLDNISLAGQNISEVANSSRFIGYSTSASALLNLVQNLNLKDQNESGRQTQIESYLSTVKNTLVNSSASDGTISQDGNLITFNAEDDQVTAVVGVNKKGYLFLMPDTKLKQTTKTQ